MPERSVERVRFGPFLFDLRTGRLEKHGYSVKLQPKCAVVLACLLERCGEVVTREDLRDRLWPSGTYVDFDLGIKVALKKLRDALGDSHEEPKYIQTVRGEGYRFVGQVTELAVASAVVPPEVSISVAPGRSWQLWAGVAAGLLLAVGVGVFFALRKPAIQFHSRDWVLIADFDNRTGERVLDGTLEYAVERELSNSQFVNVVPRERVQDALRLMKKPPDTKLDRATAREVCLRDGAIKAVLVGRVEKIGSHYQLSVQIVDPARDVAVAGYTEEDPADTLLAGTVRKLSTRVREALGEQTQAIDQSKEQLAKVTTPSLRALQLYTQADRIFAQQNDDSPRIAGELLEQALREDPDFASAHVLLAYAYGRQGRQAEATPHFRRAFELADKTTERERYFILASYYQHQPVNQPEKAAELYETLVRRYPVHGWQLSQLAGTYTLLQQPEKNDDLSIRMADLRPNDPRVQVLAAWNLAVREIHRTAAKPGVQSSTPDFSRVDHYLGRAFALRNTHALEEPDDLSVRWYTAQIHWMEGRFAESRTDALDAERSDKNVDAAEMAKFYAAFGNLREAEKRTPIDQASLRAMLAYYRGDMDEVRRSLRGHRITPVFSWFAGPSALMMAHVGLLHDADAVRTDLADFVQKVQKQSRRTADAALLRIVEGEIAVAKGDTAKGDAILEKTLADADDPSFICNLMASEDLAQAYRKQGKLADAIRVLERATSGPVWPANFSAAWQERLQLQLAQLYREAGRTQDAARVESVLAKELAFADADHPISRQLAALANAPVTTAKKMPVS